MEQKEKHFSLSWFFKWFLDNKAITVFLVTLLLGLNLFILSKISFLFSPVLDFLVQVLERTSLLKMPTMTRSLS